MAGLILWTEATRRISPPSVGDGGLTLGVPIGGGACRLCRRVAGDGRRPSPARIPQVQVDMPALPFGNESGLLPGALLHSNTRGAGPGFTESFPKLE